MGSQAQGPHSRGFQMYTQRNHTQAAFCHVLGMESMSSSVQTQQGPAEASHTNTNTCRGEKMWFQVRTYVEHFTSKMVSLKTTQFCKQNKQFLCTLMFKISAFYNIFHHSFSSHGNHSSALNNEGCAICMRFLSTNFFVLAFHCLVCLLSLCFRGASSHSSAPSVHP